jgi:hypothetical protein
MIKKISPATSLRKNFTQAMLSLHDIENRIRDRASEWRSQTLKPQKNPLNQREGLRTGREKFFTLRVSRCPPEILWGL